MDMMTDKIKQALETLPHTALSVTDDSHHHIGHVGNPDGKGQTHFTVDITSSVFAGKSRLERQRMVLDLIKPLWSGTTLHALQIRARTPDEAPAN